MSAFELIATASMLYGLWLLRQIKDSLEWVADDTTAIASDVDRIERRGVE